MNESVKRLLAYSWRDIDNYEGLTLEEKTLITKEEFDRLYPEVMGHEDEADRLSAFGDALRDKFGHLDKVEDRDFYLYLRTALEVCPSLEKPALWPILASFIWEVNAMSDSTFPHRGIMSGSVELAKFASTLKNIENTDHCMMDRDRRAERLGEKKRINSKES